MEDKEIECMINRNGTSYAFAKLAPLGVKIICKSFVFLLCVSCGNNYQKKELDNLNAIIDLIIFEQYNEIKTINSSMVRDRIDSIYLEGNRIIEGIEKEKNQEKYLNFCNEYGDGKFEIIKWNNKELLKTKMKVIQLYSLNKEIKYFYQSHFQVDLLGIIPLKRDVYKNKHEVIEIIPRYISSIEFEDPPIIIIDSDTLEYTGNSYLFNCFFKESGKHIIKSEVIVKRWNDTLKIDAGFRINVK